MYPQRKPVRTTHQLRLATFLLGGIAMSTAYAQSPAATDSATHADPAAIIGALKDVAGNPKAVRASFAKGQCLRGNYVPSSDVKKITRSLSFTRPSPVVARFSIGGGNPHAADTNKTVLRGFAFKLGGDHQSDILVENAPVHFAKTLDQMLAFLKARTPGADGKPDPEKVKAFSEANPETLNQAHFIAGKNLPGSFAGTTYWGVHSFPATNAKGQTQFIKFKVVPVGGEVTLTDEEAKTKPADFLQRDLEQRIAAGTVRFDILALVGRPGDPTMDATVRWPDEDTRESVRLGTVSITSIEKNQPCDDTIFNPSNLAEGVGRPPDEMFAARTAAYGLSLARRKAEVAP